MTETESTSPPGPGAPLTIAVMAAGIGSRYASGNAGGALKQLESVGPDRATITDYIVFDAWRAGFEEAVFVVRPEIEADFRERIGDRIARHLPVRYVHQTVESFVAPATLEAIEATAGAPRTKPWGTAHAALCAAATIDGPFALVNADDWYGPQAFGHLARELTNPAASKSDHALVGYPIRETLSDEGPVSRGVCVLDDAGALTGLLITPAIEPDGDNAVYEGEDGERHAVPGGALASMNCWGFRGGILPELRTAFADFIDKVASDPSPLSAEIGLPNVVLTAIREGRARVKSLRTDDRWLGLTHPGDLEPARSSIRRFIDAGSYPETLWPSGSTREARD